MTAILESLTEGLLIADAEGNVLTMNPEALRQNDFGAVEEVQQHFTRFADLFEFRTAAGEVLPLEAWPLARVLRGERFADLEVRVTRRDTGRTWVCSAGGTPVYRGGRFVLAVLTTRDVTDRKQAEEALRRSEERFRLVVASAPNGIVLVDAGGRIVLANEQVERAFGYDPGELHGESVDLLVPHRVRGFHSRLRSDFMSHAEQRPMGAGRDLYGLGKDGTEFPVEIGLTPIETEGEAMVLATIVDITERKRAEETLRRSEKRYRTLMEAVPQMLWVLRPDGTAEYFNERWAAYTGLPEQPDGDAWMEVVHPFERDRLQAAHVRQMQAGQEHELAVRMRRHDGAYRWHLLRIVPMRQDGDLFAWLGNATDIDERKRAEDQLSLLAEASSLLGSSLDYEQILQYIAGLVVPHLADWCAVHVYDDDGRLEPVAFAHLDPARVERVRELSRRYPSDPDKPHSIARVARAGEPILLRHVPDAVLAANAHSAEHLELLHWIGFRSVLSVPLKSRDRMLGAIMMVWAESGNSYDEADLRFAQELAVRFATAIENARLYRQARDAEARLRTLNEQLEERVQERTAELLQSTRELARSNQALQQRNRELQDFAYVASHDLQEPLRKISTFADMIAMDVGETLGEQPRFYLRRMQDAAIRASQLVHELLEFSRVVTHVNPFRAVDLNAVLAEVLRDQEMYVQEVGGRVEVGRLPVVEADPSQLRQLLQHLVSNALKFRRPDLPPLVRIRAEVRKEKVNHMPEPRQVCVLEVCDNGIGFDEKYLDRIFTPFQRLHGRGVYPGTGMGLAIVRRIVERHGGDVTARSTPGEGSTFVIRLPVRQADTEMPE